MLQVTDTFNVFIPDTTFGIGGVDGIGKKAKSLNCRRPLLVTDAGVVQAGLLERIEKALKSEGIEFGLFAGCQPNAPYSTVTACVKAAIEGNHDMLIAVGGGSIMDTAKAASIAATGKKNVSEFIGIDKITMPGLPMIFIPTTAGTAAEWSHYANVTDDSQPGKPVKKAMASAYLRPAAVIVDPLMTLNLPQKVTADTGIDTLAHGIEPFTSWRSSPIADMVSGTCIGMVAQNLRAAYGQGAKNVPARYNMSIAASLGFGFTISAGGNIHAMAHPLQMSTSTTHGEAIGIVMPVVMAFNMIADLPKFARIAELMGEDVYDLPLKEQALRGVQAVRDLIGDVGMPLRIRDVGGKKEDIPGWVETVFQNSPHLLANNCRKTSKQEMQAIYEAAW